MGTSVVIPWAGGCQHRQRALEFVSAWHTYPVTVAKGGTPWVKAEAVNPAVRDSSADIIVVADADCVTAGLPAAVEAVASGRSRWAIPHRKVVRLTEESTDRFIATGEVAHPLDRRQYTGIAGGGFVVARRETLLEVPMDPRFVGWGHEDEAWAMALTCLAGKPWRGDADLIHLWHPPQPKIQARKGSEESWGLLLRYGAVRRKPSAMRLLLKELHDLEANQPSVSDRSSWS